MTFVLFNRTIASLAAACILSSCAQLSTSAEQSVADEPVSNIPKEALTGENLFQLLLAEKASTAGQNAQRIRREAPKMPGNPRKKAFSTC